MEYCEQIKNKPFRAIYRGIITVQRVICYICAIALPLIITYQVVLRYVLKAPLMGIEELMTFFIIWLYMMGGSVASEQRTHIECGILTLYIKKEKTMAIFLCFKNIFSMVVCIWLTRWAYWLVFMLFFGVLEMIDAFKNAARIFGGNTTEEVDKE